MWLVLEGAQDSVFKDVQTCSFKKKKNNWRGEESTSLGVFVGTLCLALVSWVALMALSFWIAPHMLRLPGEDGGQMAALCIIFLK